MLTCAEVPLALTFGRSSDPHCGVETGSIISGFEMLEKRIVAAILLSVFLFAVAPALGQTDSPSSLSESAAEKAAAGDYPAAIELYQRAVNAESSQWQKKAIQDKLDEVTKNFYRSLYEEAQQAVSREERIRLLTQAQSLKIRDWLFTDFEQVVFSVRRLREEIFRELLGEATTAVQDQDYGQALSSYELARALDPELFESENLSADYDRLNDQVRIGKELVRQAHQLLDRGRFEQAKEKFEQARTTYPGSAIEDGLRKTDSMLLLRDGKRHASANQFGKADRAFRMALEKYQENSEATRLLEESQKYKDYTRQGRILYRQGSCQESQRELKRAQVLNSNRFKKDALAPLLRSGCSERIPLPVSEVREGLLAFFDGHPDESIQILESLVEQVGEGYVQLHAFLGVAYCHTAFTSSGTAEPALGTAREQFRMALEAEPNYQLSEKLFSPRILQVFEESRSEARSGSQ